MHKCQKMECSALEGKGLNKIQGHYHRKKEIYSMGLAKRTARGCDRAFGICVSGFGAIAVKSF